MKNIILKLTTGCLFLTLVFAACKKDDNKGKDNDPGSYKCQTCPDTPEAAAENDNKSKGIYKGIVIGSSGTIKFNIANNNSDITATLVIDGNTIVLTSTITWADNEPYVAPFVGEYNGQPVVIHFKVENDGTQPVITAAEIPGHPNAVFTIVKETSNALIEGYEGTYSKSNSEKGTFNIILSKTLGKWGGIARQDGSTEIDNISGEIDANGHMTEKNGYEVGTLIGETISGTFTEKGGVTVTIEAKRTM